MAGFGGVRECAPGGGSGVDEGCAAVIYGTGEVARGAWVKCLRFSRIGVFAGVFGERFFWKTGFWVWGVLRAGAVGCATVHVLDRRLVAWMGMAQALGIDEDGSGEFKKLIRMVDEVVDMEGFDLVEWK